MGLEISPEVTSIAKAGSAGLNGAVTLTGGTNVTLTQSGQDISIASSGGGMSIGGTVTSGTTGSILFVGAGPVLAQDNTNFFWDDTNNRMGIGTPSPASGLEIMNTNATDISLILQGAASQSADLIDFTDSSGNILTSVTNVGRIKFLETSQTSSTAANFLVSNISNTMTISGAVLHAFIRANHTVSYSVTQNSFTGTFLFYANMTIKNASSLTGSLGSIGIFVNTTGAQGDTNATTCSAFNAFLDSGAASVANAGTLTITEYNSFKAAPNTINSGVTVTTHRGIYLQNVANSGTITTNTRLEIDDVTTGTTKIAIRQKGTTGHNRLQADTSFAQDSAPGAAIDVAGKLFIANTGLITKYNNITTVSGGVPSELATVDLTGQTAAKAATTIYTPAATGLFRLSIYLQVTTAATTSSILGGATGVVITFNDGDGNVAQTNTAALATTAGAIAVTAAGNTTATNLEGTMVIYARTGVAIQYAIGYTSVGVTAMQYAAHLKVEAL